MRRTVWDGEQELAEVQAPGAPADAALWEQDVGHYAALPLDFRSSPPKDPNRYYGQVVYTTGLAVDQPLSVQRLGYADRPTGSSYTQWSSFGVIPLWDRQGTAKLGVFSDGAWARQLVPSPTLPCQLGASAQRCVQLVWPEASSIFDAMRGWAPQSYMGSLLEQKRNASGTYYRRARVYDPATGRFTQEDPIGLAGGLNLYGYANGDPVNFSDPFGLCTPQPQCFAEAVQLLGRMAPELNRELATFLPKNLAAAGAGALFGGIVARVGAMLRGGGAAASAEVTASAPVGMQRAQMNVPGINRAGEVGGRRYTGHAFDQMQGRGITPTMVEETIAHGARTAGREGATVHQLPTMRVVVNPSGSVKTVMWQ
jgi:RHS repeat-associated protein